MLGALLDELQRQAPWDLGAALLAGHLQLGQGILQALAMEFWIL